MNRRALLGGVSLGAVALLAACSATPSGSTGNPLGTVITVNLGAAQSEAKAILQAVELVAASVALTLTSATQAKLTNDLNVLTNSVSEFAGLPSGSVSIAAFAGDVVTAVGGVVALLPLPAATGLAIGEGLLLIKALIAGHSAITVTAPVSTGVTANFSPRVIAAPIPIPLS